MPVGIGPDELRGDLGAINGRRHDTEGLEQDRNIETGEMKQFGDFRVGQKPLDVFRPALAGRDLNDIGGPIAARQLDHAKPVAREDKP